MANLITLDGALREIKQLVEEAIREDGTAGKNNLIRSQRPIKLIHEVVKSELIRNGGDAQLITPALGQSNGELSLAGFFKKKDQDICLIPNGINPLRERLDSQGILFGKIDDFGLHYTERTLSINVRSQLSSSAKNFDTLYERTFAEALNLHLRCPNMVLGEVYMIAVNEYDSNAANQHRVQYRNIRGVANHIEKYLLSFEAVNNRIFTDTEHYKYERVCLLIVDFGGSAPKVYNSDSDLRADNLLPDNSLATIQNLSFPSFASDLLNIYNTRFGNGR